MKQRYQILAGGSFAMPDGSVKTAGDEIDLDSDVAANHAKHLQALPEPAPAPAPAEEPAG